MSGYLGARTQIADTGAYNREQADDLFPSKESVVAFSSTGADTTMVKPPVYGIRVLEFTAATGTITLPDMSAQSGGGRFRILKNNATQGAVNINLSGTNVGIWGSVQLKLNADGDFWELQWTGSRFVLTDGHENETNENGYYINKKSGSREFRYYYRGDFGNFYQSIGSPSESAITGFGDYIIEFEIAGHSHGFIDNSTTTVINGGRFSSSSRWISFWGRDVRNVYGSGGSSWSFSNTTATHITLSIVKYGKWYE